MENMRRNRITAWEQEDGEGGGISSAAWANAGTIAHAWKPEHTNEYSTCKRGATARGREGEDEGGMRRNAKRNNI
eukprot:623841-Pyramimonas_sp.AAC.1